MSFDESFVGEIIMLGCNFAPKGFALCDGQLLPISINTALFSILGTTYGGDGRATFALPNLQGMVPIGAGQGAGLTDRILGETGGQETVTLTMNELPFHTHLIKTTPLSFPVGAANDTYNPVGHYPGVAATNPLYALKTANVSTLSDIKPAITAKSMGYQQQPVNNMQPTLGITFAIAMQGIFPPRG